MKILQYHYKQREFDGKWMVMAKVPDLENSYRYKSETNQMITLVPTKWIIVKVYDYMLKIEGIENWEEKVKEFANAR